MSDHPAQPTPTVTDARACLGCGYDLRGAIVSGNCPECATPVARSLREPILANSSPAYLRDLEAGAFWQVIAVVATVLSFVAIPLTIEFIERTASTRSASAPVIVTSIGLFPALFSIWATWRLTTPDPQYAAREQPGSSRRLVRSCVLVMFAADVLKLILATLGITATFTPAVFASGAITGPLVAFATTLVSWGAWALHFFAIMQYARWLARRVPDVILDRRARRYTWLLPLWATVGLILLALGPLIAAVLYARFFWRLRRVIRDQRFISEAAT